MFIKNQLKEKNLTKYNFFVIFIKIKKFIIMNKKNNYKKTNLKIY